MATSASTAIKGLTMLFLGSANAAKLTEIASLKASLATTAEAIATKKLNK